MRASSLLQAAVCAALLALAGPAIAADPPAPAPSASLPAQLPLRRDAPAAEGVGWWPAAVFLLALAAGGGWLAWRRGPRVLPVLKTRTASPALARLASQPLTPQASLHVVHWQGEELLVGCTTQQVTVLARRAAPPREPT